MRAIVPQSGDAERLIELFLGTADADQRDVPYRLVVEDEDGSGHDVEVSTCVIEPSTYIVGEGADPVPIIRDTEIGHFEFGGSTHMMIFQKDRVKLEEWAINAVQHQNDPNPTPMGTVIARALPIP